MNAIRMSNNIIGYFEIRTDSLDQFCLYIIKFRKLNLYDNRAECNLYDILNVLSDIQ
jgi:hypothetical protein